MQPEKIRTAVQVILSACFASDDPVACFHAEIDRLSASGEWSELEIRDLHSMALDAVQQIARGR